MERTDIRRLAGSVVVAMAVGLTGALLWSIGLARRDNPRQVIRTPLWPRPDGSVRSYGEVWEHPEPGAA